MELFACITPWVFLIIWLITGEILEDNKMSTTTEQYNTEETKKIIEALDNYVWYDMPEELAPGIKAKSGQVLTALVYILVEKGFLSSKDIQRLIKEEV